MPLLPLRPEPAEDKLEDVATEGMNRQQRKAARIAKFQIANSDVSRERHRNALLTELAEDMQRPDKHLPGRRGGRRVRLVWANSTAFNVWQTRYRGLRRIGSKRFALTIGTPAYENPGDDLTPPSGRAFTEIYATEAEQDWFEANGVLIANPGTFDTLTEDEDI